MHLSIYAVSSHAFSSLTSTKLPIAMNLKLTLQVAIKLYIFRSLKQKQKISLVSYPLIYEAKKIFGLISRFPQILVPSLSWQHFISYLVLKALCFFFSPRINKKNQMGPFHLLTPITKTRPVIIRWRPMDITINGPFGLDSEEEMSLAQYIQKIPTKQLV